MPADTLTTISAATLLDLGRFGYLALAAGVLLENAGIPVPGETLLLAAAALARSGRLSIVGVAAVAAASAIVGDNIGFAVGRLGGRPLVERFGRFVLITPERLHRMDDFFAWRGPVAVVIARFIAGLRVVAALTAGTSNMRWRTFVVYNAVGAVAWATTVSAVGYAAGSLAESALPWLRATHLGLWATIGVAAVVVIVYALIRTRLSRRHAAGPDST